MLKTLLVQVKEFKLPSILTPACMIGEVICEMIIPVLMGRIVDLGIGGSDMQYILDEMAGGKPMEMPVKIIPEVKTDSVSNGVVGDDE